MSNQQANNVVIFDFETTGLSPQHGDRAIEIGAVKLVNGEVVDTFAQLMDPGRRVSSFITNYTGISNEMLASADSTESVMAEFAEFIVGFNLVAHNASFDRRFLVAEFDRIGATFDGEIGCSLLASRRIFQQAFSHKLGDLISYLNIDSDGQYHRALYDAQMTAKLWLEILETIESLFGIYTPNFDVMQKLGKTPKHKVQKFFEKISIP